MLKYRENTKQRIRPMRVLLCGFVLFAQTVCAHAAITPQELREMAYAGDIHGAEAALAQAHQETLDGTLSYDELRELVTILIVSHPDVLDFVEDWMQAYPDSPYAKSLRVFQTQEIAWTIRTYAIGRNVSPEAMQMFRTMQSQGMDMALSAYQTAPDYIPASDAVLTHNLTTKRLSSAEHLDILSAVLDVTPSRGSLARASMLASRQWGGAGYQALIGLCDRFAERITDVENYSPEVCVIDLIHYFPSDDAGRAYSYELMEDIDHPILAKARAQRGLERGHLDDLDEVIAYLSQPDVLDNRMMRRFERTFGPSEKVNKFMDLYIQQKRAFVEEGLLHDPYDGDVLFAAFDFYDGRVVHPGTNHRVSDPEMQEFEFLLSRRYVAASPYTGHAWMRMANAIPSRETPEQTLRDEAITYEPVRMNAVYFGQHDSHSLFSYLQSRVTIFESLQRIAEEGGGSPLTEIEALDHVLCPLIRLDRLNTARCEADGLDDSGCYMWSSSLKDRIRNAVTEIERKGLCRYEQDAPLTDLLYTEPMPFDLGELNDGIANR